LSPVLNSQSKVSISPVTVPMVLHYPQQAKAEAVGQAASKASWYFLASSRGLHGFSFGRFLY